MSGALGCLAQACGAMLGPIAAQRQPCRQPGPGGFLEEVPACPGEGREPCSGSLFAALSRCPPVPLLWCGEGMQAPQAVCGWPQPWTLKAHEEFAHRRGQPHAGLAQRWPGVPQPHLPVWERLLGRDLKPRSEGSAGSRSRVCWLVGSGPWAKAGQLSQGGGGAGLPLQGHCTRGRQG